MIELLTIALTGFVSVFALGFQSRNVNHLNYSWAFGTSIFVGFSQALLWKHIIDTATVAAAGVYAVSGGFAIVSSMYIHERFINKGKHTSGGKSNDDYRQRNPVGGEVNELDAHR